jgi:hypothetical protein
MRINEEKTQERLSYTAQEDRVYIYDASLVLEFLRETFINPKAFIVTERLERLGDEISRELFAEASNFQKLGLSKAEIYEEYIKWRMTKPYSTPLEKMWKFFVILKRMRFYKNGWQFASYRKGTAQIVYFTPLKRRSESTFGERMVSNPSEIPKSEEVEVTQEDINQQ